MAPTAWRAAISFSGLATVVADEVRAETASAGTPSGVGRLSSPVALDTHGLPEATTAFAPGFPASELRDRAGAALPRGLGLRGAGERRRGEDGHEAGP